MTTIQKSLKDQIVDILKDENKNQVDVYASYCQRQLIEVDKKTGKPKNSFMKTKSAEQLAQLFLRVQDEGLVFDGKHITLQSTGISYDYVAYKNKLLSVYPETKIDLQEVKEGDVFIASKENGQVFYTHKIYDPMQTADFKTIVGAYCIIKMHRGEFLTTLSKEDLAKHRKVAKGDFIWSAWFKEMVLKTVIKKACKYHFEDIFESMNEIDNESIDLDKVIIEDIDNKEVDKVIKKIESINKINELQTYYLNLAPQFIKNGDVLEAYNAQKELCKTTK